MKLGNRTMQRYVIAAILAVVALLCLATPRAFAGDKPDILEIVNIDGVINDGMANQVAARIEEINDNPRVKAVVMVVDSPGGGVIASAAIYEELSKLKVPVVAWCNSLCASGGMYVSMAPSVKYIGVRTQTISGSIGVIMTVTRYGRLLTDKLRIDTETYKSGRLKDAGNGTRAPEEGETAYLQGEVQGLAEDFYAIVKKARGDKIADWDAIRSARIFFGAAGVRVGLVDEVMSRADAEKKAKLLSGSKVIYTRDEMKKMAKDAADAGPSYQAPDLGWVEELREQTRYVFGWMKEIRRGQAVRVEYRMPWDV